MITKYLKYVKFILILSVIGYHVFGENPGAPPKASNPTTKGEMFKKMSQTFKHNEGFDPTFVQLKKRFAVNEHNILPLFDGINF